MYIIDIQNSTKHGKEKNFLKWKINIFWPSLHIYIYVNIYKAYGKL